MPLAAGPLAAGPLAGALALAPKAAFGVLLYVAFGAVVLVVATRWAREALAAGLDGRRGPPDARGKE